MYNNTSFFGKKILCGIHFDKEVRSVPNFETQKSRLDAETIIEKEQSLNEKHSRGMIRNLKIFTLHPKILYSSKTFQQ